MMVKSNKKAVYIILFIILYIFSPVVFRNDIEGLLFFLFYPYLMLPIVILLGLSTKLTDCVILQMFNVLTICFLLYFTGMLILEGGSFNLF